MSRKLLEELYRTAVKRVDPYAMVKDLVSFDGSILEIPGDSAPVRIDLGSYHRILVIGAGKASAPMALALEEIFAGYSGDLNGLISVKYGHTAPTTRVRLMEAGHPVPDDNSIAAGRAIAELAASADRGTLVLNCISGGGSALMVLPAEGIEYGDIQEMTRVLLECGADIHELNTLRKHTSGIKGGRLAELVQPGRLVNILLSDVVGDNPQIIASGPGVPDPGSFRDVEAIVRKYGIRERLPDRISRHFLKGQEDSSLETPKPGSPVFDGVSTVILGNNRASLEAAAAEARRRNIKTVILSSRFTGEARELAKAFAAMALEPAEQNILFLAGGETTVTIRGDGLGGRNQELALSYLETVLRGGGAAAADFLAAGSDGNDGPTDAAGGIICAEDFPRITGAPDADPGPWLARNDSYNYLSRQDLIFKTGPTNTNVCDFCFLYIRPAEGSGPV